MHRSPQHWQYLQQKLQQPLQRAWAEQGWNGAAAAAKLGYTAAKTAAAGRRIERLLQAPDLGLLGAGYDFRYGNRALLLALCALAGLDQQRAAAVIDHFLVAQQQQQNRQQALRQSVLSVQTADGPRPQTVFGCWAHDLQRRLRLPETVQAPNTAALAALASAQVAAHVRQYRGRWGRPGQPPLRISGYRLLSGATLLEWDAQGRRCDAVAAEAES